MYRRICLVLALVAGMTGKAGIISTINNVSDLQNFATSVNSGDNYSGVTVRLNGSLDLSSAGNWTSIGTSSHPFVGTFDGQGYTISNLSVNTTETAAGLFGFVSASGEVRDVNIGSSSGMITISGDHGVDALYLAAVVGNNAGRVVGCSNKMTVSGASYEHARIGGIVGTNESGGRIENCYNLGTVYTSLSNVFIGGIVGYNSGTVTNSWMSCTVTTNASTNKSYPLYGENTGTVVGCFYAGGTNSDAITPAAIVLANAADNTATISDNTGNGKNVLLDSRTLLANGDWNTLCLPFSIPSSGNGRSPIAGATVKEFTSAAINGNSLNVAFTEVTTIEAGKPYLIRWSTGGNISNPMFLNVTISKTTPTEVSQAGDKVKFIGTFSPMHLTKGGKQLYVGTGNQIHYPSGSVYSIKSCRAYFDVDWSITAGARLDMNIVDGETTGIRTIDLATPYSQGENGQWTIDSWSGTCYDLQGRKIENSTLSNGKLPKGLYIVNGRKVVLK